MALKTFVSEFCKLPESEEHTSFTLYNSGDSPVELVFSAAQPPSGTDKAVWDIYTLRGGDRLRVFYQGPRLPLWYRYALSTKGGLEVCTRLAIDHADLATIWPLEDGVA